MKKYSILVILFSMVLMVGGVIGYIKAGSLISFGVSAAASSLLVLSAAFGYKGRYGGLLSAALLLIALDFFFIYRVLKTSKLMPAGLMALLCTLFAIPLLNFLKKEAYAR